MIIPHRGLIEIETGIDGGIVVIESTKTRENPSEIEVETEITFETMETIEITGTDLIMREIIEIEMSDMARREVGRIQENGRIGLSNALTNIAMTGPTDTIIIKGLPGHATEPMLRGLLSSLSLQQLRDVRMIQHKDGECKGFAFVQFHSIPQAESVVHAYGGNRAPLYFESFPLIISFADKRDHHSQAHASNTHAHSQPSKRMDWLCGVCHTHNFARRDVCFKCHAARTGNETLVSDGADSLLESPTPTTIVVVYNLPLHMDEEAVAEVFRPLSPITQVTIVPSAPPLAFVFFPSLQGAAHAYKGVGVQGNIRLAYAKEDAVRRMLEQGIVAGGMAVHPALHPYAHPHAIPAPSPWGAHIAPMPSIPAPAALPAPAPAPAPVPVPVPARPVWPPPFETHGAMYVFQGMGAGMRGVSVGKRGGIFYEPLSDFYYSPKAKLYYSGKEGRYFRYQPLGAAAGGLGWEQGEGYVEFLPPAPLDVEVEAVPGGGGEGLGAADAAAATAVSAANPPSVKPIVLSVGSAAASGASNSKKVGVVLGLGKKKVREDISKWGAILK
eukprot:gene25647-30977_t